jgi:hypothetical protein
MVNPLIQIDDLVREMSVDEANALQEWQATKQAQEKEAEAKIAARQSALAKLAKLGLTQAEIDAL